MRPRIFGCKGVGGILGIIFPIAAIFLLERLLNKEIE